MPELLSYLPRRIRVQLLFSVNRASRHYLCHFQDLLDKKPDIVKNLHLKATREVAVTKSFKMQELVTFALRVQHKGVNYLIIGASDQTILLYSEVD